MAKKRVNAFLRHACAIVGAEPDDLLTWRTDGTEGIDLVLIFGEAGVKKVAIADVIEAMAGGETSPPPDRAVKR